MPDINSIINSTDIPAPANAAGASSVFDKYRDPFENYNAPNGTSALERAVAIQEAISAPAIEDPLHLTQADYESYKSHDVVFNRKATKQQLDKQRAENEGFLTQMGKLLGRTANELIVGVPVGFADAAAIVYNAIESYRNDTPFQFDNEVSNYLHGIKDAIDNWMPIYRENPEKAFDITDASWWAEQAPSIATTVSLMVPAFAAKLGATKALSLLGKGANKLISNSTRATRLAELLTPGPNTSRVMEAFGESAFMGTTSRAIENFQEARQVQDDTREYVLNQLKELDKEENKEARDLFYENNPDFVGKSYEEIADAISIDSAQHTFALDWANLVFDILQFYSLRSLWKARPRAFNPAELNKANRLATTHFGQSMTDVEAKLAERSFLQKAGEKVKDYAHDVVTASRTEWTEGIEEMVNYIAQEDGTYLAKTFFEPDAKNYLLSTDTTANMLRYATDPHMWEQFMWGTIGGVFFGAAGNRFANYKYGADNADYLQQQKAEIYGRAKTIEDYYKIIEQINSGVNPYFQDKDGKKLTVDPNSEDAEILRGIAMQDMIKKMMLNAKNVGNEDLLIEWASNPETRRAMQEKFGFTEEESGELLNELQSARKEVNDIYNDAFKMAKANGADWETARMIADNATNISFTANSWKSYADKASASYGDTFANVAQPDNFAELEQSARNVIYNDLAKRIINEQVATRNDASLSKRQRELVLKELDKKLELLKGVFDYEAYRSQENYDEAVNNDLANYRKFVNIKRKDGTDSNIAGTLYNKLISEFNSNFYVSEATITPASMRTRVKDLKLVRGKLKKHEINKAIDDISGLAAKYSYDSVFDYINGRDDGSISSEDKTILDAASEVVRANDTSSGDITARMMRAMQTAVKNKQTEDEIKETEEKDAAAEEIEEGATEGISEDEVIPDDDSSTGSKLATATASISESEPEVTTAEEEATAAKVEESIAKAVENTEVPTPTTDGDTNTITPDEQVIIDDVLYNAAYSKSSIQNIINACATSMGIFDAGDMDMSAAINKLENPDFKKKLLKIANVISDRVGNNEIEDSDITIFKNFLINQAQAFENANDIAFNSAIDEINKDVYSSLYLSILSPNSYAQFISFIDKLMNATVNGKPVVFTIGDTKYTSLTRIFEYVRSIENTNGLTFVTNNLYNLIKYKLTTDARTYNLKFIDERDIKNLDEHQFTSLLTREEQIRRNHAKELPKVSVGLTITDQKVYDAFTSLKYNDELNPEVSSDRTSIILKTSTGVAVGTIALPKFDAEHNEYIGYNKNWEYRFRLNDDGTYSIDLADDIEKILSNKDYEDLKKYLIDYILTDRNDQKRATLLAVTYDKLVELGFNKYFLDANTDELKAEIVGHVANIVAFANNHTDYTQSIKAWFDRVFEGYVEARNIADNKFNGKIRVRDIIYGYVNNTIENDESGARNIVYNTVADSFKEYDEKNNPIGIVREGVIQFADGSTRAATNPNGTIHMKLNTGNNNGYYLLARNVKPTKANSPELNTMIDSATNYITDSIFDFVDEKISYQELLNRINDMFGKSGVFNVPQDTNVNSDSIFIKKLISDKGTNYISIGVSDGTTIYIVDQSKNRYIKSNVYFKFADASKAAGISNKYKFTAPRKSPLVGYSPSARKYNGQVYTADEIAGLKKSLKDRLKTVINNNTVSVSDKIIKGDFSNRYFTKNDDGTVSVTIGDYNKTYKSYQDYIVSNNIIEVSLNKAGESSGDMVSGIWKYAPNASMTVVYDMPSERIGVEPTSSTNAATTNLNRIIGIGKDQIGIQTLVDDILDTEESNLSDNLEQYFANDDYALNHIKQLKELGVIPDKVFINTRSRTSANAKYEVKTDRIVVYAKTIASKGTISLDRLIRILIHEKLHAQFNDTNKKADLSKIEDIYNKFEEYVNKIEDDNTRKHLKQYLNEGKSKTTRLEEFVVESITSNDLMNALNEIDYNGNKIEDTKKESLFSRLLKYLAEFLGVTINENSLLNEMYSRLKEFNSSANKTINLTRREGVDGDGQLTLTFEEVAEDVGGVSSVISPETESASTEKFTGNVIDVLDDISDEDDAVESAIDEITPTISILQSSINPLLRSEFAYLRATGDISFVCW